MNDRARAREILQRARELLLDRLTDRVLQTRDELFEDALGMSFGGEIAAVYEQVGVRLTHVNALLATLPDPVASAVESQEPPPRRAATDEPAVSVPLALPGPDLVAGLLPVAPPLSLDLLGVQFQAGDVAGAGQTLGMLLGLGPQRATICAHIFHERFRDEPHLMRQMLGLRQELALGRGENLLAHLWECFALEPLEAVGAIQSLKLRLIVGHPRD